MGVPIWGEGIPDRGNHMNKIRDGKARAPSGNREGLPWPTVEATGGRNGKALDRQTERAFQCAVEHFMPCLIDSGEPVTINTRPKEHPEREYAVCFHISSL